MKKSLLFAIILLLISPLDVNANPFEKAFKELEKGLEDLADELEGNDKNKKDSKDNKNLPESWKKENSNMATYKACQKNGGKPINNPRGTYFGFFDPCLPADYVVSPASPQECTNSKGETKNAKSGTDPNNMCGQAYKIAQEKKAQQDKANAKKFANDLESRVNSYRSKYEPMVKARLAEFRAAAGKNKNITTGYQTNEWGDNIAVALDESQPGVRVFYDIKVNESTQECRSGLEDILISDSYDIYDWKGNPKKNLPRVKKIANPNEMNLYNNYVGRMFIESNPDNFLWTLPIDNMPGIEVYFEFTKPLSIEAVYSYGSFQCYGTLYQLQTTTEKRSTKSFCFNKDDARALFTAIPLEGEGIMGKGMKNTTLNWAFDDFYSGKNTDGTQIFMFTMNDGSKTKVEVNPFHPAVQEAYDYMCK